MFKNQIRYFIIFIIIFVIGSGVTFGQKKVTVHGNIVEITSYVKEGLQPTSPSKKEVVIDNLKKGGMFGIVDKANKLYLIVPNNMDTTYIQTVSPYFGIKSFVKGQLYTRGGVRVIVLEDIGKSLK